MRHTTAMHLLQSGVDSSTIALWLGHESPTTTHRYVEADLAMKEQALARLQEPDTNMRRYQAPDSLMRVPEDAVIMCRPRAPRTQPTRDVSPVVQARTVHN